MLFFHNSKGWQNSPSMHIRILGSSIWNSLCISMFTYFTHLDLFKPFWRKCLLILTYFDHFSQCWPTFPNVDPFWQTVTLTVIVVVTVFSGSPLVSVFCDCLPGVFPPSDWPCGHCHLVPGLQRLPGHQEGQQDEREVGGDLDQYAQSSRRRP